MQLLFLTIVNIPTNFVFDMSLYFYFYMLVYNCWNRYDVSLSLFWLGSLIFIFCFYLALCDNSHHWNLSTDQKFKGRNVFLYMHITFIYRVKIMPWFLCMYIFFFFTASFIYPGMVILICKLNITLYIILMVPFRNKSTVFLQIVTKITIL